MKNTVKTFLESFLENSADKQEKIWAGGQYWGGLDNPRPHASQGFGLLRTDPRTAETFIENACL